MLEWVHELNIDLAIDNVGFSWLSWDSLSDDFLASFLGFNLFSIVFSNSSLEGFSAFTLTDVFDSDVNSLGDDSCSDLLVNDDTDSVLVDIKDLTSLALVELVWHTLVNTSISNDINKVTLFVCLQDF